MFCTMSRFKRFHCTLTPNCKFESERGEMKEADTFEVDSFTNSLLVIPKYLYRLQSKIFSPATFKASVQ